MTFCSIGNLASEESSVPTGEKNISSTPKETKSRSISTCSVEFCLQEKSNISNHGSGSSLKQILFLFIGLEVFLVVEVYRGGIKDGN